MDLISHLNLDKQVYMSRTGIAHESLLTVRNYKYIRKVGEVEPVDCDDAAPAIREVIDVAKGAAWMGIFWFYITHAHGPMAAKIRVCCSSLP